MIWKIIFLIQNGLTDVPYKGVVEGYFKVDSLSKELKEKFEKYKELVKKEHLEDEDFAENSTTSSLFRRNPRLSCIRYFN